MQTGVAEKGATFAHEDLAQALKDGALLRLRPKVMTVATIVRQPPAHHMESPPSAEIMKPLATPVIGGMISSLLHILIVTPVIFIWLRDREFKKEPCIARFTAIPAPISLTNNPALVYFR